VYAQPLYVPDVMVNGSIIDMVFAATEHSSVFAFNPGEALHTSLADGQLHLWLRAGVSAYFSIHLATLGLGWLVTAFIPSYLISCFTLLTMS